MGKRQKRKTKKQQLIIKHRVIVCIFLCFLVIGIGYFILLTDYFKPRLDELTTSYISFNNSNSTDILKFDNLERMNDKKGIYLASFKSLEFTIPKEKDLNYDIVLIPINSMIEDKYIHYVLSVNDKDKVKSLDVSDKGDNDERIIYNGSSLTKTKISLYMWISDEYKGKINNISYEVKIKSR